MINDKPIPPSWRRFVVKREAELKVAFTKELKKVCPGFLTQMMSTAGAPDRSITGSGRTTHWEFKHGTPAFVSPGNQELFCMRLAVQGHCRYVLWIEDKFGNKRTMIVHPRNVHNKSLVPETFCIDFDHEWLVRRVMEAHGLV